MSIDGDLTVLLRMQADTKQMASALKALAGDQAKLGTAAKETADKQESAFKRMRDGLLGIRGSFGELTGAGKQALGFLGGAADEFAKHNKEAGASWVAANKEWDAAISKVKQAIGSFVVGLAPLISALAETASGITDVVNAAKSMGMGGGLLGTAKEAWGRWGPGGNWDDASATSTRLFGDWGKTVDWGKLEAARNPTAMDNLIAKALSTASRLVGESTAIRLGSGKGKGKGGGGGGGGVDFSAWDRQGVGAGPGFAPVGGAIWQEDRSRHVDDAYIATAQRAGEVIKEIPGWGSGLGDPLAEQRIANKESLLKSIFGPLDEFQAYSAGFNILSSSATSAFDAWASGALSAGQAFKQFIGDSLKGTASALFGEALKYGAMGTAELFVPGMQAAGLAHLRGAAVLAAGSVAVGALARQFGGGGGGAVATGGGGSSGGGGGSRGGGGGGSSEGSNVTIYLGDYFGSSPREQDGRVARAVRQARKTVGDEEGVQFR